VALSAVLRLQPQPRASVGPTLPGCPPIPTFVTGSRQSTAGALLTYDVYGCLLYDW